MIRWDCQLLLSCRILGIYIAGKTLTKMLFVWILIVNAQKMSDAFYYDASLNIIWYIVWFFGVKYCMIFIQLYKLNKNIYSRPSYNVGYIFCVWCDSTLYNVVCTVGKYVVHYKRN